MPGSSTSAAEPRRALRGPLVFEREADTKIHAGCGQSRTANASPTSHKRPSPEDVISRFWPSLTERPVQGEDDDVEDDERERRENHTPRGIS